MEKCDLQTDNFNRNEKQVFFNQIRGTITEINIEEDWCSFTLNVGHENQRLVNLSLKRQHFEKLANKHSIGDKVLIRFFLTSRFKHGRWHTTANVLDVLVT